MYSSAKEQSDSELELAGLKIHLYLRKWLPKRKSFNVEIFSPADHILSVISKQSFKIIA